MVDYRVARQVKHILPDDGSPARKIREGGIHNSAVAKKIRSNQQHEIEHEQ